MKHRTENYIKRVAIDIAGVFLILLALVIGWLPGPFGIPLLIAGLGLLSINHEWAARWLERVKSGGAKIFDKIFTNHPLVTWGWDIATVGLFAGAMYLFTNYEDGWFMSVASALVIFSLVIFCSNRHRLQTLANFIKTHH